MRREQAHLSGDDRDRAILMILASAIVRWRSHVQASAGDRASACPARAPHRNRPLPPAVLAGQIGGTDRKLTAEGYPEDLEVLVKGVNQVGAIDKKLKFLRRIRSIP